jgi:hypothetical protein
MDIDQYHHPPPISAPALPSMGQQQQGPQAASANLVENDVEMIMVMEEPPLTTASFTAAPPQENDAARTSSTTRTTQQAYHYWTSAASETPRSSLSDLSAAPPRVEDHNKDGYDHDDPDIEFEDCYEDDDGNRMHPNEVNQGGGRDGTNGNGNNESSSLPARVMSRMMNSSIQQQQQQQQGLQDWESTRKEMNSHDNSNMDRNSDESSSVGKTGNSQSSSRDWGWFEDVHAASDRPWSSGGKDSPLRDGRKYSPKDSSTTARSSNAATNNNNKNKNSNSGDESRNNNNSNKRKTVTSLPPKGLLPSQDSLFFPTETLQPLVQRDPESGESMTLCSVGRRFSGWQLAPESVRDTLFFVRLCYSSMNGPQLGRCMGCC